MNTRTNHGALLTLERIELHFTLTTPPPGMKWHREDGWTAEMLPPGTRPLTIGESFQKEDEVKIFNKFEKSDGSIPRASGSWNCNHYRTTRPLLFTHEGHEWTWHRPGDPMPCDGGRKVEVFFKDGTVGAKDVGFEWEWGKSNPKNEWIIGWRYADEKPDSYAALKEAHAAGKVIQQYSVCNNDWYDLTNPSFEIPPVHLRIKPDDAPPWIEWHGGPCPLKDEEVEEWEYKCRNGYWSGIDKGHPSFRCWKHDNQSRSRDTDITAYRVLKWRTPKPKVPLGPEDVPPGSMIKRISWDQEWVSLSQMTLGFVVILGNEDHVTFEELQSDWLINRSIPLTGKWNPDAWEPCEK